MWSDRHPYLSIGVISVIFVVVFGVVLWYTQIEFDKSEYNYSINYESELTDTVVLSVDYSLVNIYSELYDVLVYEDSDGNHYKSIAGQKPYTDGTHGFLHTVVKVTLLYEIPKEHYDGHITCLKTDTKLCHDI